MPDTSPARGVRPRLARLSSRFVERLHHPPKPGDPGPPRLLGPADLAILGPWFGLVAGLGEVLALLLRDLVDPRVTVEVLRTNQHWIWMVPLANLLIAAALGGVLAGVVACRMPWGPRLAMTLLVAFALLPWLFAIRGMYLVAYLVLAVGVAAKLAPALLARIAGLRRVALRSGPPLAIGMAVVGVMAYRGVVTAEGRALAALPAAAPGSPNLLLIVLDTVRADALSLHGYARDTSPNLARLAREGVRFDQARSTAPWTLPSHASMFTGRWPHELSVGVQRPLDDEFPTVAEALAARGYATGGFVSNTHFCNARFGLGRGFHRYEDLPENRAVGLAEILRSSGVGRRLVDALARAGVRLPGGFPPKHAEVLNRDAIAWITDTARAGRPYFAFLNYFDAHHPYVVPAGERRHFGLTPEGPADHRVLRRFFDTPKTGYSQREFDLARDGYDDCIAYVDEQVGQLLADLRGRGLLENTVVVVTADHGEAWGEHQLFGHGRSLYRAELHVPLIVVGPRDVPPGRVVGEPVSLRDLPATVLDLLGQGDGDEPFPGRSLARFWGPEPAGPEPILSEVSIVESPEFRGRVPAMLGPMSSLLAEGLVYIRNPTGREELYDFQGDQLEAHNLAAHPSSRETLRRFREQWKQLTRE